MNHYAVGEVRPLNVLQQAAHLARRRSVLADCVRGEEVVGFCLGSDGGNVIV